MCKKQVIRTVVKGKPGGAGELGICRRNSFELEKKRLLLVPAVALLSWMD